VFLTNDGDLGEMLKQWDSLRGVSREDQGDAYVTDLERWGKRLGLNADFAAAGC